MQRRLEPPSPEVTQKGQGWVHRAALRSLTWPAAWELSWAVVAKEFGTAMPSCAQMGKAGAGAELVAIEAIYRRRLPELRRVATAITGSREGGRDAVQDAFALAVHRRHQFRGEGSLEAWLWRIVVHSCRDLAGRAASRATAPLDEGTVSFVGPDEQKHAEVIELVGELPERQRLALFLRYYADLDYVEMAEALEISTGTVGATLTQARDNLRRLMTGVRS
jgi:RNA polymerase sigma-70 factor (ECF subfamily)